MLKKSFCLNRKPKKGSTFTAKSVFAKRGDREKVYLSKEFNEYFTQDFFDFVKKFPLLQPKVKSMSKKLKEAIKDSKVGNQVLEEFLKRSLLYDIKFENRDLLLAANAKNISRLLQKVIEYNEGRNENNQLDYGLKKTYPNSNKPLGTVPEEIIDYSCNMKNKRMIELKG